MIEQHAFASLTKIIFLFLVMFNFKQVNCNENNKLSESKFLDQSKAKALIKLQKISNNLQDLPGHQLKCKNKYTNKSVSITTLETFKYSSTVLNPIFVSEKQFCHTHDGFIEITKLEDVYYGEASATIDPNQQLQQFEAFQSQSHSWIYNKKYSVLYKISSTLRIDAYQVNISTINKNFLKLNHHRRIIQSLHKIHQKQSQNQKSIKHVATLQLLSNKSAKSSFFIDCHEMPEVLGLLSKNLQKLYVLACNAIYTIQCRSVLIKSEKSFTFSDANPQEARLFFGIQVKIANDYIFWLSEAQGIRIFKVNAVEKLQFVGALQINPYQPRHHFAQNITGEEPTPKLSSLQYSNGLLYLLTLNEGIYIYQRIGNFNFQFVAYLEYLPELMAKANKEILISDNYMFIWTESKNWQFVTLIKIFEKKRDISAFQTFTKPLNQNNKIFNYSRFSLVRYFKGYKSIAQIQVINEIDLKQNFQEKALLIISERGIQMFPVEKDPREIFSIMNGIINNRIERDIKQIHQIHQGIFLFESYFQASAVEQDLIQKSNQQKRTNQILNEDQLSLSSIIEANLVFLEIIYPQIQCRFTEAGKYILYVEQSLNQSFGSESTYINSQDEYQLKRLSQHQNCFEQQKINKNSPKYHELYYHRVTIEVQKENSVQWLAIWISIFSFTFLVLIIALLIRWRQKKLNLIENLAQQIKKKIKGRKIKALEFQESSPEKALQKKWEQLMEQIESQLSYKLQNSEDNPNFDNNLMSERMFENQKTNQDPLISNQINFHPKQQNEAPKQHNKQKVEQTPQKQKNSEINLNPLEQSPIF